MKIPYEFDDDVVEYEVDYYDEVRAVENIIGRKLDINEDVQGFEEPLKSELEEYFYDVAKSSWRDQKSYNSDPLGFNGMSWRDFI